MDAFTQVCAVGLLGSICVLLLKKGAPELGFLLSLLIAAGAALFGLRLLTELFDFFQSAAQMAGLPAEWLSPVYKTVGISIMSRLSADLVRDTGQIGAAGAVEIAGVLAAIVAALPLLRAMLALLSGMTDG